MLFTLTGPMIERALAIHRCRELYERVSRAGCDAFGQRLLAALDAAALVSPDDLASIPPVGPLIVAANHPHGALDGLVVVDVVRQVRSDVRVLTNRALSVIPELAEFCLFVDAFETTASVRRSFAGLRAAHEWLRRGGAVIVFPAGEVAHLGRGTGCRIDSPWKATFAKLAESTGATVVPAFISGTNSKLFYAAGRVHPVLRTALLGRELLNARGRRVRVALGAPLPRIAASGVNEVRRSVDALADRPSNSHHVKPSDISAEIDQLPPDACLVDSGPFQVFCTTADAIPATVDELGRLREQTYRGVGEGTGRDVDVDRFDAAYLHLFAWDRVRRCIVGAYRIGRTDRIVDARGVNGLYTRTLFRYDGRLLDRIGAPALELGRSFVRAEYQRSYNALLLLWKGIGQFVVRNPRYRVLFGPVSISARYARSSHELLASFLRHHHLHRDLAALVRPVTPAPLFTACTPALVPKTIDELDRLVARGEQDGKGVPVLLRQYLKLNAQLLGFNVDPNFRDSLDALMIVDLAGVEPAILNRYLGRAGAIAFRAQHQAEQPSQAA